MLRSSFSSTTVGPLTHTNHYHTFIYIFTRSYTHSHPLIAQIRPLWRHYYANMDGIMFVVDAADRGRIDAVRDELHRALQEDELRDSVLLVFANKQDQPGALTSSELAEQLGLTSLRRKWYVQACCATAGEGVYEGMDWLTTTLLKRTVK